MTVENDYWGNIAARLSARAAEIRTKNKAKPDLRLIRCDEAPVQGMDEITRESQIRLLRALRRHLRYMQVELFFEQALVGKRDLDDLSDGELVELHKTVNKAQDHYHNSDGVSYYEAGLLKRSGGML